MHLRRFAYSVLATSLLLLGGCALWQSPQSLVREQLRRELGWDPVAQLAAMGSAAASSRDADLARQLCGLLNGQQELRLLRFGLGHDDERVVFGTVAFMSHDSLPVPELRHAAEIVVPRLADVDCPIDWEAATPLIGSGDFAALVDVIPRLPEAEAVAFLGALHRMVRPDAIEAMCALAIASEGEVRSGALANADMTAYYSGLHVELLIGTYLRLAGREFERENEASTASMPRMLRAALTELNHSESAAIPLVPCARWLVASRPEAADLPLLRDLLLVELPICEAAAWALGSMHDEASRKLLQGPAPKLVSPTCWSAARARRGDEQALAQLLAGEGPALAYGLAVASPEQRLAFFERLLTLPNDRAHQIVGDLGAWVRGELAYDYDSWAVPPCEQHMFAALEPLLLRAAEVRTPLLRAMVWNLPGCETVRMADALLQLPASELFSAQEPDEHQDEHIGHGGAWAFLEVTRPEPFVARLREGLDCDDKQVRDLCAELLIRVGDTARLEQLVAFLDDNHWTIDHAFERLARGQDPRVRELLRARANDSRTAELPALAVALGLPFDCASGLESLRDEKAVREALFDGDVTAAFLAGQDGVNAWHVAAIIQWHQPHVTRYLKTWRDSSEESADTLYLYDQALELASGDPQRMKRVLKPLLDGRYATHSGMLVVPVARAVGLELLPFLIDDLGSNCCKVVLIDELLLQLFSQESNALDRSRRLEPASMYLRRTLLPVADRLLWSRIADGYVVSGT